MDLKFDIIAGTGDDVCISDYTRTYTTVQGESFKGYADEGSTYIENPDKPVETNHTLDMFEYSDTMTINYLKYVNNKSHNLGPFFTPHTCEMDGKIIIADLDEIHIPITTDGYYEVHHFVLPTKEFFITDRDKYGSAIIKQYIQTSGSFYYTDGEKVYKQTNTDLLEVDLNDLINEIANLDSNESIPSVSYESKTLFLISQLKKCFVNLSQKVFDASISGRCLNKCSDLQQLTYNRDFVWMTLNVIEYYVEDGHLFEAQKNLLRAQEILETVNGCGAFCEDNYSMKTNTPCNCGCH